MSIGKCPEGLCKGQQALIQINGSSLRSPWKILGKILRERYEFHYIFHIFKLPLTYKRGGLSLNYVLFYIKERCTQRWQEMLLRDWSTRLTHLPIPFLKEAYKGQRQDQPQKRNVQTLLLLYEYGSLSFCLLCGDQSNYSVSSNVVMCYSTCFTLFSYNVLCCARHSVMSDSLGPHGL